MMITLKQLAEQSGFSIRTVRRVLANQPHVNPEKRRIIMELAEKNCYVPNMAARSLRLQQKNCVGVLLEDFSQNASVNKLNALDAALVEKGFCPLLGRITPGAEAECEKMLSTWAGVAEYVVVFPVADNLRINFFQKLNKQFPLKFIFVDCDSTDLQYCVPVDRVGSVRNMVLALAEMKYKHLLYCGSLLTRKKGIEEAEKENLPLKISCLQAGSEFSDGENAGEKVLASGADVVFFDTDRAAAGFYRFAAGRRVRIPEDISIVGFDNELYSDILTPPLASLAHPEKEIAERILQIISGDETEKTPLKMRFIKRKSLKNM
ncbi:MAG: LacI family DNA-binding transcriptional regulator [Lentisphaeria bacterium]|nr:LacI family DNA-binding transcriptional regulator [Lentisphaeria bacterium]